MSGLNGARIALLEGRMSSELAALVRRHGGEPYCVPAVRETPLDCEEQVAAFLSRMAGGEIAAMVFLTGVGATALFRETERLGRLPELLAALGKVATVCRGPKPTAALKRQGVPVTVTVPEPHTATELLAVVDTLDLDGKGVGLTHYGERNGALAEALRARGARLEELCLYEWVMPDDLGPLRSLVAEVIAGRVDAVAITSQVQVRHLFRVAAAMGQEAALAAALQARTVTAAVGPTAAAALRSFGVTPHLIPDHPKMGHLVLALARRFEAGANAAGAVSPDD